MGDTKWKLSCAADKDDNIMKPIASDQDIALAMIVLKNNYFAWLWDMKRVARDELVTDYDPQERYVGKKNINDGLLKVEFDIPMEDDEEDEEEDEEELDEDNDDGMDNNEQHQEQGTPVEEGNQSGPVDGEMILVKKSISFRKYNELKRRTDMAIEKARNR